MVNEPACTMLIDKQLAQALFIKSHSPSPEQVSFWAFFSAKYMALEGLLGFVA